MIKNSKYIRIAVATLMVMGLAAGPILIGAHWSVQTMYNAPLQWVPRHAPARQSFNEFIERFQVHETVLVSWPGCTMKDERTVQVADALMSLQKEREHRGEPALIGHVLAGYSLLKQLQDSPASLAPATALRRLQGIVVGKDSTASCVVIALTEQGAIQRREVLESIKSTVAQVAECEPDDLRMAGPPVDGLATDDASIRSLQRYSILAILISFALCWLCLRSLLLTIPILIIGALGQSSMLAAVYYLGVDMNAVLIVLPALVFVLTISAGVHLVNYFYDEVRSGDHAGATARALKKGWLPCALAALTTAIGLGSLMVSGVGPIRMFGFLAAIGVLSTVLLLFLILPGAMELALWWENRDSPWKHDRDQTNLSPGISGVAARFMSTWARPLSVACLLFLIGTGVGLIWLKSSINVVSLLSPENRAVQDFRWFEREIGPLISVELIVHFDETCELEPIRRLQLVSACHTRLNHAENVSGAMSAATFFPTIPRGSNLRKSIRRSAIGQQVEGHRADLIAAQFLSEEQGGESWRISARVAGIEGLDYGSLYEKLEEHITPLIKRHEKAGTQGIRTTFTGVTSVVYEIENSLLQDLFHSFLLALILATVVITITLKSIPAGLVAMVPNVFPTVIMFGGMGWIGRSVDIGTIMTASVALGVAVDGTLHFLKWYRHDLGLGRLPSQAILYSYQHCGRALFQSTAICGLGLIIFAFSDFLPARHFSITMLVLLIVALVGDLVVLPALLLSPFGKRVFRPSATSAISHEATVSQSAEIDSQHGDQANDR